MTDVLTGAAIPDTPATGGATGSADRLPAGGRVVGGMGGVAPTGRRAAPELVLRWMAVLAGAVLVARSGSSTVPLLWGLPLLALTSLRTAEVLARRHPGRLVTSAGLVIEVAVAALAACETGGWHSGWVVTLVGLAALGGYLLPERWSGQVASAAVIALFLANLAGGRAVPAAWRDSVDLDGLLLVAVLAVSYAAWLARSGNEDRTRLAASNQRLMATNDLLVLLERILMKGEDATDPQQAARAVARLARELVHPDVVVVAALSGLGDSWRILLAEGATVGSVVGELEALERAAAAIRAGGGDRPLLLEGRDALVSPGSRSGVCVPLLVRDELIGAVILESGEAARWADRDLDLMAEMGRWAALIVDNARRFNTLWVVGSAEERARVARNLHDNLGQSMAALGLELDWLARVVEQPEHVERIRELRQGVTNMVAELRFNMRDLCCDVSETRTLGDALTQLVQGLESRSRTRIRLDVQAPDRLPLALEHQVLQMARILLGAAVDSRAEAVDLAWVTGREGGCLEVGYDSTAAPGARYETEAPILMAVAEVRDRCWAVGATVECEVEEEGRGRVRCRVAA